MLASLLKGPSVAWLRSPYLVLLVLILLGERLGLLIGRGHGVVLSGGRWEYVELHIGVVHTVGDIHGWSIVVNLSRIGVSLVVVSPMLPIASLLIPVVLSSLLRHSL